MIKLLNGHSLTEKARFQPESMPMVLNERQSTATITIGPAAPEIKVGDWLQDMDEPGAGIVWRVKTVDTQYETKTRTLRLEHVINSLRDRLMFGEVKPADMSGTPGASSCTAEEAVQYILDQQSDWILGGFDYSEVTNPYNFDGDDLFSALETVSGTLEKCWWTLDTTVYPFIININHRATVFSTELRMMRNISTAKMTVDKSRMYTRLYPIGKNNLHIDTEYVSKNENIYGIISKTETDNSISSKMELVRWATERLNNHCEPAVTVTVGVIDLSRETGEDLDHMTVGVMCRMPLPGFNTMIEEIITQLNYPDKIRDPEEATATLANIQDDVASIINNLIKSGGRSGRVSAKDAEEDHAWIEDTTDHVTLIAEAAIGKDGDNPVDWSRVAQLGVDGEGISGRVTRAEGDIITAQTAITANENAITLEAQRATGAESSLSGQISVEAGKISQIVTAVGEDGQVTAASICLAINDSGDSEAKINASKIYLLGQTIADTITANYIDTKIQTLATLHARDITANTITAGVNFVLPNGLYLGPNGVWQVVLTDNNDNTYTLKEMKLNGDERTIGTFSRATSLSGAWASGVFTTSASPQGNTLTTSLTNTGHWGNTADNEDPTHFYYKTYATVGSSPTVIDTGNVYEINASSMLQDKTGTAKFTANGTYSAASGYIGFGEIEIDVPQSGGGTANVDVRFNGSSGSYYIEAFDSVTGNPITGANLTYQLGRSGTTIQIQDSGGSQISGTDSYTIPLETRSVAANGTYTPGTGKVGISSITVNVPSDLPNARSRFNAASGSYYIEAYDNTTGNAISGSSTGYKLGVSGATVQVQTTGGSQISSTPTLALDIDTGSVNSSGSRTLTVKAGGSNTTKTATITDYASGWTAARGKCSIPVGSATAQSIAVKYPATTVGGQDTTNYYVTADDTYAYIRAGGTSGTVVARVAHSAYSNGQTAAGLSINGNGTNTVTRALSSSTKSVSITATAGISYNSSTHKYTATAQSKAGSTNMGSASAVSGTEAYDAGKNDTIATTWFGYTSSRGSSSDSSFIDISTPDTTRYLYAKERNGAWSRPNITWYLPKAEIFTVSGAGSHHIGDLTPGSYICAGYSRGGYSGDAKYSAYTYRVPGSGGVSYNITGYSGGSCPAGSITSALSGYTLYQTSGVPNSQSNTYRYIKFSVDGRKKAFYFS